MNWLAHVFLSEPSIHEQLGNLLTDPLKGRTWEGIESETKAGIAIHLRIDSFTDANEIFLRSCSRLGGSGRLRSVVVDLAYDHMLSRNWHHFSDEPLPEFLQRFYVRAVDAVEEYPQKAKSFIAAIIESNRLGRYGSLSGIENSMGWIDKRLSDRVLAKERTLDYLRNIESEYEDLCSDFMEFFPQLQGHVGSIRKTENRSA